ncbi:MAG: hypothetical protein M3381_14760 [Actinomycetota bacterium]|nr:hypothetical protein [Actinomycetota bacterium]
MNRADYLVKPCPAWCVRCPHKPDRILQDVEDSRHRVVTFMPSSVAGLDLDNRTAGAVQICINSTETLDDDEP